MRVTAFQLSVLIAIISFTDFVQRSQLSPWLGHTLGVCRVIRGGQAGAFLTDRLPLPRSDLAAAVTLGMVHTSVTSYITVTPLLLGRAVRITKWKHCSTGRARRNGRAVVLNEHPIPYRS